MVYDRSLDDLFATTITIEQVSSLNDFNVRTYAAAVTYPARVVNKLSRVVDFEGRETAAMAVVWIAPETTNDTLPTDVTPDDRLTLPDGTTPPILGVNTFDDEDGAHHMKIFLGRALRNRR